MTALGHSEWLVIAASRQPLLRRLTDRSVANKSLAVGRLNPEPNDCLRATARSEQLTVPADRRMIRR